MKTANRAEQIKTMPGDVFTETIVPCQSKQVLAEGLWQVTRRGLSTSGQPQLVDWGIDDVQLKDGPGKVAAIVYTVEPGDPGAITKAADHYLVSGDCRVLHWGYTDDSTMIGD